MTYFDDYMILLYYLCVKPYCQTQLQLTMPDRDRPKMSKKSLKIQKR